MFYLQSDLNAQCTFNKAYDCYYTKMIIIKNQFLRMFFPAFFTSLETFHLHFEDGKTKPTKNWRGNSYMVVCLPFSVSLK